MEGSTRRTRVGTALLALVLAVTLLPGVPVRAAAVLRIGTWGDSITAPCGATPPAGYCAVLGQLLDAAGVQHVFVNRALAGSDCGYTASNAAAWLASDQLDLVLLDCGTNNVPSSQASQDVMGAQWRTIVEAVHALPSVKLGISFIGYSNPNNASAFGANLPVTEATANDVIFRQWQYELGRPGWSAGFAGLADFQAMPGDPDYLDSGGIHPNALGAATMATIWYRALAAAMGWPAIPAPCGLWGARPPGTPYPTFIPCEGKMP